MAWKGSGFVPPPKGCGHAYQMHWTTHRCWCGDCGVSWKWDPKKGWVVLPISRVKYGEEVGVDYW